MASIEEQARSEAPIPYRLRALLPVLTLVLASSACSNNSLSDLQNFVREAKSRNAGRVAPLPEFKTYQTYSYASSELRDPFDAAESEGEVVAANGDDSIRPDSARHREALENFPLDALKYVGHMERNGELWGFVSAPDQLVYRIKEGNYLGQNHGRIRAISENGVAITEIIPDGLGGWIEREASLVLAE